MSFVMSHIFELKTQNYLAGSSFHVVNVGEVVQGLHLQGGCLGDGGALDVLNDLLVDAGHVRALLSDQPAVPDK